MLSYLNNWTQRDSKTVTIQKYQEPAENKSLVETNCTPYIINNNNIY